VRAEESLPLPPRTARENRRASQQTPPEDFLEETIRVWQPYAKEPLSREDAREILANVSGFFRVLRAWSEEDRRAALDLQK
jgi:hypothetical protein